jgi:chromosome segregation ATPase
VSLILLQQPVTPPTTGNDTAAIIALIIATLTMASPHLVSLIRSAAEKRQEEVRTLKQLNEAFEAQANRWDEELKRRDAERNREREEMRAEIREAKAEAAKAYALAEKIKADSAIREANLQKQINELKDELAIVTAERDQLREELRRSVATRS